MRTQNLQKEIDGWRLRNNIADWFGGERHYTVRGMIAFMFSSCEAEHDLLQLRTAILEADRAFPWRDDIHPETVNASIHYLSDGVIATDDFSTPEKHCRFTIVPVWDNLRKGQVYGYEKYLNKLAEEIAKRGLPGVTEVRSVIGVRSTTSYPSVEKHTEVYG